MIVTLTVDEIKEALADAIANKINHLHSVNPDDCYFDFVVNGNEIEEFDDLKFSVDI